MKIGFSTSVIQRGQTGVAQYVFALLRGFARSDSQHEFTLFVLKGDLPLFTEFADNMRIVPVSECFRSPVANILWHQTYLPGMARGCRLDVLHIPSYRRLIWPHPCALVATIHDLAPFHLPHKYDPLRMFYARVIARRLAQRQDAIIAISRSTARDIFRFFDVPRQHVRVIYNGLDHARFAPDSCGGSLASETPARVKKLWKLDRPYFLYVSRLEHPGKNHVRLIAAFDHFKHATGSDWQLVFAGKDWHGAEAIHEAISHSPFRHDIRSLGFVADSDLPILYRAAGASVYPSLFEGFGMPPVEAMACGCPVLCSDRGALGEVIGDAALIVDPEDVHDLARKLRAMAGDSDLRARLRERGFRQARRFDWHETAAATLELYERAAALHSGRDNDVTPDEMRALIDRRARAAKSPSQGLPAPDIAGYDSSARETRLHFRTDRGGLPGAR